MDRLAYMEEARPEQSSVQVGPKGGTTYEFRAGVCCHASGFEESMR